MNSTSFSSFGLRRTTSEGAEVQLSNRRGSEGAISDGNLWAAAIMNLNKRSNVVLEGCGGINEDEPMLNESAKSFPVITLVRALLSKRMIGSFVKLRWPKRPTESPMVKLPPSEGRQSNLTDLQTDSATSAEDVSLFRFPWNG
ncbi:MAG: hypothetical protein ACTS46_01915 [Candidatus Hodgkinia cicadicola]